MSNLVRSPVVPLSAQEATDRFHDLIMNDRMGQRFNKISDRYVYHYTNMSGLRGILASGTVWASDYRYLNDRSEFVFGLEILEMLIAAPFDGPKLPPDIRKEVLMEIALMRRGAHSMYVLSASFCQKGNVLSQWRSYGRDSGVAIGFNRLTLEERARTQSFVYGPVRYYFPKYVAEDVRTTDAAWLQSRFDDLMQRINDLRAPLSAREIEDDDDSKFMETVWTKRAITRWVGETAAFIKHPAFSEEAEWRCLRVYADASDQGWRDIRDRASGAMIVPHVDLDLRSDKETSFGIDHLVVGPSADLNAAMHSISHLLNRCSGIGSHSIVAPFNPLRT